MTVNNGIEIKINRAFEYGKNEGVNFSGKEDKSVSSKTIETYCNVVKAYNSWLKENYNVFIDRAKPRHAYEYIAQKINAYKDGEGSAFTLKKLPHALHAFRELSAKSGVFRHICNVGDKRVMLDAINKEGIMRRASDSKSLKANHSDYVKVQKEISNSRSKYKEYVSNVHEAQRVLGLRIHEAVKMQVRDINFETGEIRVVGKGGLERFVKVRDEDYLDKLKALSVGKKDGADVFRTQNKKGNPPGREQRAKIVKEEVRKAAERAGADRNGKKYTSHSGRKAFAQERVNEMKKMSKRQVEKEFKQACENEKIASKAKAALKHIKTKIKNEKHRSERKFSKKEMVLFLVSCEIGHFRLDVMRYYCDY